MSEPVFRRTRISILSEILRLLRLGETGKTEIAYIAKLDYRMVPKYLNWLLESGLITESVKEYELVSYRITEKGLKLLSEMENLQEMLHVKDPFNIFYGLDLTEKYYQSKKAVESSEAKKTNLTI